MASDTSLFFNFLKGRDTVSPAMASIAAKLAAANQAMRRNSDETTRSSQRTTREVFKVDNVFRNSARRMASMAALIGGAILAALGHAVAFTQAIWPMIGALAAVPAVSFGVAAGLAPLIAIFSGLFAAMKKAGGGASNSADQIAAAERRIAVAQRSATQAQQDLNDAREEAADRLRDIGVQYARVQLDQREAAQAVRDAEIALRQARAGGDINERRRAELALQSARLSQVEIANRLSDVEQEYQDRQAKGIDGSDEVRSAAERQADALYELAEAQKALAKAQAGGGASAQAQAYAKLSAAGKQLVDMLHKIGPAWSSVKKEMQQAGLKDVAGDVEYASNSLLKQKGHLVGISAAWNTALRSVLGYFGSVEASKELDTVLGKTVVMSQHLAAAWVPFLRGFMSFVVAGSDYLPRFGAWIEKLSNQFANWARNAAETGKIQGWIEGSVAAAKDLGHWIRDISGGIGEIFKAGSGGPNYLANLADDAKRWRDTMASPEMQDQLGKFFESTRTLGSSLWVVIKALTDALTKQPDVIKEVAGAMNIVGAALKFAADHADLLNKILPPLISGFLLYKSTVMAIRLATMAWTAVQVILNAVMDANPISLIIIGVGLLVAAFIYAWNHFEGFRNFWKRLWAGIQGAIQPVVGWFKTTAMPWLTKAFQDVAKAALWFWNDILHPIFKLMGALFRFQWAIIKPIFQLIWAWIKVLAGIFLWWWRTSVSPVLALLGKAFRWLWENFLKPVFEVIKDQAKWLGDHFKSIVDGVTGFVNGLSGKWDSLVQTVKGLPSRIAAAAAGMWEGLKGGLKDVINWLIDQWNKLDFGIHIHLPAWAGGYGFDINDIFPDIPRLAKGGTAIAGGLALVGEQGPELLSLPRGATVAPLSRAGGAVDVDVTVRLESDGVLRVTRKEVRKRGGNATRALAPAGGLRGF